MYLKIPIETLFNKKNVTIYAERMQHLLANQKNWRICEINDFSFEHISFLS